METEAETSLKSIIPKLIIWGGIILLLTYGKILWPLMFGYMRQKNAGLFEALSQFHLHSMAFMGLLLAIAVGYLWARTRYGNNEH